jgi:hypothetical protein
VFPQEIAPGTVPFAIKQAFTKKFPAAKALRYEKEDLVYRIGFLEGGKQCFVSYNEAGKMLETEKAITTSNLPKEVAASVTKNFKGYTIMEAVKREVFDKGICYEMDLMKDQSGFQVRFSEKGEILLKVARKVEVKVITKPK